MPHLVIQHSGNISTSRMQQACDVLHDAMVETGIFPLGGIRVRAWPSPAYAVADKHANNAFVDMVLRMAKGRTTAQKRAAGEHVMSTAQQFFAEDLANPHFSLSLEVIEIDDTMSWKANSIHPRLKAAL
jgi:5-carboxymethyl-2-hydroxymuconate isomerase